MERKLMTQPPSKISRRDFLATLSALGLTPAAFAHDRDHSDDDNKRTFAHGVASGDPLHDRVILWTRTTPRRFSDEIEGKWRIATDERMKRVCNSGRFSTDVSRDFTVKIDADDLEPGRTYFYQFEVHGETSPTGRTRTLPLRHVDRFRMAFASCSNYPYGYFNPYARIAERDDIDLVLHLGDYIYEYELGGYANPKLIGQRDVLPANEIITLTDYRIRHALYKADRDLQEAHRRHPFICVWDDHESANDSYEDGAENHNPEEGEGEWTVRKRQAIRAYNEYMPIRTESRNDDDIFRRFRIGSLADLIMLDTRLHGRDKQAAFKTGAAEVPSNDPVVADSSRSLLGFDQERWLERQLWESKLRGADWRVLGQQVMMAQLSTSFGRTIINPDQWDGYQPARSRLFDHLASNRIGGNVVLTGDIHSAWCADLVASPWDPQAYDPPTGKGVLGVEFVSPAVTSPGPAPDAATGAVLAAQLRAVSPHLKYIELFKRGYGVLDLTRERAQGEIYHVGTIDEKTDVEQLSAVFVSEAGNQSLVSG
jgi:alkaline phosphatase D